ncbi:MAG: glycosyltransferase family 4 protein [Planctomycetota bacterium]
MTGRVLRVLTRPNVGGPTRQAVALWHAQRALGWRTLLVTGRCRDGEPSVDLGAAGVPRVELDQALVPGGAAQGWVELPELQRQPHPARDRRAARRLVALLHAWGPDVVHTHTSKAGWLGRAAARRAAVPVVAHTYHGHVLADYYPGVVSAVLRRLEARAAARTDLLFAVSPTCRRELIDMGIGGARLRVVPPAIEYARFAGGDRVAARRALRVAEDALVLGFVGRLVRIKRPDLFADVVAAVPGGVGVAFGDGPLHAGLAGGGGRVHWLGVGVDLPGCLGGLDVLVMPSEREGCPLAAVEAMAAGVPVVGFDVPGVRDVLGEWGRGVLVPRGEGAAGLARAVRALAAEPERRRSLIAAGQRGLARFAPTAVAAALCDAYRQALAERHAQVL